jgi:cytochrome oxidase Cu insertion factor (SCO1/SenC/PrrC family)
MIRRAALGLLCAALGKGAAAHDTQRSAAELMDALMWNREPVGGPFSLLDHQGRRRTHREFRGRFLLVYFGFTQCPDVCPADLHEISLALEQLGPAAAAVQPLFITLDPQRDTPARLATYVAAFHPRLVGLTGTEPALHELAAAYRLYFRRVPAAHGGYTIEHAAFTYLMDRHGRYIGFFPPGTSAARMIEILRPHLEGHPASVQPE